MSSSTGVALLFSALLSLPVGAEVSKYSKEGVCRDHRIALEQYEAFSAESAKTEEIDWSKATDWIRVHNALQDATSLLHRLVDLRLSNNDGRVAFAAESFWAAFKGLDDAATRSSLISTPEATEVLHALASAKKQTERAYYLLLHIACLD